MRMRFNNSHIIL